MKFFSELLDVFFPRRCAICGKKLVETEKVICSGCTMNLPYTNFRGAKENHLERRFWGIFPIERASAYIFYNPGSDTRNILFGLKYYNHPEFGVEFGRRIARELLETDFFDTIDFILPIPLSRRRMRRRGYNQSFYLAKGIAQLTNLKIETDLIKRKVDNPTQTQQTYYERQENVKGIFTTQHEERIKDKHILLVDDVVTTGSTIISCADELVKAGVSRISVVSIAVSNYIKRM